MTIEPWWAAFLGLAAWPAAAVLVMAVVMLLARRDQQAAVLHAFADVVRAARGLHRGLGDPADRRRRRARRRPVR